MFPAQFSSPTIYPVERGSAAMFNQIYVGVERYDSPRAALPMLQAITPRKRWFSTDIRIDTTKPGTSGSSSFTLPLMAEGNYNFVVTWGDGSQDTIKAYNAAAITHTYSSPGVYDITIKGMCFGWRFNNGGDRQKVMQVNQWGNSIHFTPSGYGNAASTWYGCVNLTIPAADDPDFAGTANLSGAFSTCTSLVTIPAIALWRPESITDVYGMFSDCTALDQDFSALNLFGNLRSIEAMFRGCTVFNNGANSNVNAGTGRAGINGWDVSQVTNLSSLFNNTGAFNRSLADWDTSNVTETRYTFQTALAFNQDISAWDLARCTDMTGMFTGASAFNQDVSTWNVERVTTLQESFRNMAAYKQSFGAWWPRSVTTMLNICALTSLNTGGNPTQMLTSPQAFDAGAWAKTASSVSANAATSAIGTVTADKHIPNTSNTAHTVSQAKTLTSGAPYIFRVLAKAAGYGFVKMSLSGSVVASVYANLSTGAIVSQSGGTSVTVKDSGDGWYILEIRATATASTSCTMTIETQSSAAGTTFAGDGTSGVLLWGASMYRSDTGSTANLDNTLKGLAGCANATGGVPNLQGVIAASVVAAGSGYAVGDTLTLVGGTLGLGTKSAEFWVTSVSPTGGVTGISVKRGCGNYSATPAGTCATTGGSGTGCTLMLTWATKFSQLQQSLSATFSVAAYSLGDPDTVLAVRMLTTSVANGGKGWTISTATPI